MAGPAYYTATMNIAKNEDWIVPFLYASLNSDGVTTTPIDLTGSTLKLEMRVNDTDHEAIVSVSSPDDGIVITDMAGGAFTIVIDRVNKLARLADGAQYSVDFVRLMPTGYQERIWEGTGYVVEGTTR